MLDQIQEIVRKNLPAEVGDQLKKHLQDAEATARKLQMVEDDLKAKRQDLLQRDAEIARLNGLLKTSGDLDKREKDVTAREIRQEIAIADIKRLEAEKRAEGLFTLVGQVFRNPRFVTNESSSINKPTATGGMHYTNDSKTTTQDTE